jgi:hypothetical protein
MQEAARCCGTSYSRRFGVTPWTVVTKCVLLDDNAHPHTADQFQTLQQLHFEILEHPTYSSDIVPSDYHLFESLKNSLRGRHLPQTMSRRRQAVHTWLAARPKTFYCDGIQKVVQRWTTMLQNYALVICVCCGYFLTYLRICITLKNKHFHYFSTVYLKIRQKNGKFW